MKGFFMGLAIVAVCIGFALLTSDTPAKAGYGCHGPTVASPPVSAPVAVGCSATYVGYRTILIGHGKARRMERRAARRHHRAARRAYGCAGYAAPATCSAVPVGCNGG